LHRSKEIRDLFEKEFGYKMRVTHFFQLGRECVLLLFLYYISVLALHDLYANDF